MIKKLPYIDKANVVSSCVELFLSIAIKNHDNFVENNYQHQDTFPQEELLLSSFMYAYCALEAHISDTCYFFQNQIPQCSSQKWKTKIIEDRLQYLLGDKIISKRRRRLLENIREFRHSIQHPEPFVILERTTVISERECGHGIVETISKYTRSNIVKARKKYISTHYKPSKFPPDPLLIEYIHIQTALLIILEHILLLERKYKKRSGNPILILRKGEVILVTECFKTLRNKYNGPHAAYFNRINIKL